MTTMKKLPLLLGGLLTAVAPEVLAESYPAPPGVYGNEALFKELEQQTQQVEQPQPETQAIIANKPASDVPLIFIQPVEAEPAVAAVAKAKPKQPPAIDTIPAQPSRLPGENMKMNDYQPPSQPTTAAYIPDASQLNQKMQEAAELEFGQWGQALQNYPAQQQNQAYYYGPELFNQTTSMVNDQLFDNPYPVQQRQQPDYQNLPPSNFSFNSQSYPVPTDYNHYPETPSFQDYGIQMPSANQAPSDYGTAYNFGNNDFQQGYNQSPPDITHYTRPSGNNYNNYEQQRPSGQFGNQQYFRKIPEDDIIYPPHYPGNR